MKLGLFVGTLSVGSGAPTELKNHLIHPLSWRRSVHARVLALRLREHSPRRVGMGVSFRMKFEKVE